MAKDHCHQAQDRSRRSRRSAWRPSWLRPRAGSRQGTRQPNDSCSCLGNAFAGSDNLGPENYCLQPSQRRQRSSDQRTLLVLVYLVLAAHALRRSCSRRPLVPSRTWRSPTTATASPRAWPPSSSKKLPTAQRPSSSTTTGSSMGVSIGYSSSPPPLPVPNLFGVHSDRTRTRTRSHVNAVARRCHCQ